MNIIKAMKLAREVLLTLDNDLNVEVTKVNAAIDALDYEIEVYGKEMTSILDTLSDVLKANYKLINGTETTIGLEGVVDGYYKFDKKIKHVNEATKTAIRIIDITKKELSKA